MNTYEDIEMTKMDRELRDDVDHLVERYLRIFEWDIPESDEPRARKLIIERVRTELKRIEANA
ncbi:MAG: hypothetical protein ABW101_10690 [Candidatus Thiodiazotropha sp.]